MVTGSGGGGGPTATRPPTPPVLAQAKRRASRLGNNSSCQADWAARATLVQPRETMSHRHGAQKWRADVIHLSGLLLALFGSSLLPLLGSGDRLVAARRVTTTVLLRTLGAGSVLQFRRTLVVPSVDLRHRFSSVKEISQYVLPTSPQDYTSFRSAYYLSRWDSLGLP